MYSGFTGNPSDTTFNVALGGIFPYIKSTQVFVCPSDTIAQKTGNTYSLSACVEKKSLASFQETARKLLIGEERTIGTGGGDSSNDGYLAYADTEAGTNDRLSKRHLEGSNVVFVDGHVKWFRADDTMTKKNDMMLGGDSGC